MAAPNLCHVTTGPEPDGGDGGISQDPLKITRGSVQDFCFYRRGLIRKYKIIAIVFIDLHIYVHMHAVKGLHGV